MSETCKESDEPCSSLIEPNAQDGTTATNATEQPCGTVSRGAEGQFWTQMLAGAERNSTTNSGEEAKLTEEKSLHAEMLQQLYNGELEPDPPPQFQSFRRPGIAERTEAALGRLVDTSAASPATTAQPDPISSGSAAAEEAHGIGKRPLLTTFAPLSGLGLGLGALDPGPEMVQGGTAGEGVPSVADAQVEEKARVIVKSRLVAEVARRSQEVCSPAIATLF